jgi:2'-5' RNA ligase
MTASDEQEVRLFTGMSLKPEVRDCVTRVITELSETIDNVRWVPSDNLHVTLKFLGLCQWSVVPEIIGVMKKAATHLPLSLQIGEVGAFPSLGSARVIWVGAADLEGKAKKVYNVLEKGAERWGIPREKRNYRPHITIGRARKNTVRVTEEIAGSFCERLVLEVNDLVLFKSDLKSTGAEYSVLERTGP